MELVDTIYKIWGLGINLGFQDPGKYKQDYKRKQYEPHVGFLKE
jgi:hypothetical protein